MKRTRVLCIFFLLLIVISGLNWSQEEVNPEVGQLIKELLSTKQTQYTADHQLISKYKEYITLAEDSYTSFLKADNQEEKDMFRRKCGRFAGEALEYIHGLDGLDNYKKAGFLFITLAASQSKQIWKSPTIGHDKGVMAVSWSPDGKYLASSGIDKTVRIWNTETSKEVYCIHARNDWVGWSPNGKYLALSRSREIQIWDTKTWTQLHQISDEALSSGYIKAVSWSMDSHFLALGFEEGVIKIWELKTAKEVLKISGHTKPVSSVSWSSDSKFIASTSRDETVKVWNVATGNKVISKEHTNEVSIVRWSPDGKYIASVDFRKIAIWDAITGKDIQQLTDQQGCVSLDWSHDSKFIAFGTNEKTITIWDVTASKKVHSIVGHYHTDYLIYPASSIAWSPNGKLLACGGDSTMRVWDTATGKEAHDVIGHLSPVRNVSWSPDGKWIASTSYEKTTKVWNATSGKLMYSVPNTPEKLVKWSPDGKYLAAFFSDDTVRIWDPATGKNIHQFAVDNYSTYNIKIDWSSNSKYLTYTNTGSIHSWEVSTGKRIHKITTADGWASWSPDSKMLAFSSQGMVKTWDISTEKEVEHFKERRRDISSVKWSPDGKFLTFTGYDDTLRTWDIEKKERVQVAAESKKIFSENSSLDGKFLAVTGYRGSITIQDVSTEKVAQRLLGHQKRINALCWSPDGQFLASMSKDETARVWDITSGKEILKFQTESRHSKSLAWSPDGKYLVVACTKTLQVWEIHRHNEDYDIDMLRKVIVSSSDSKTILKNLWDALKIKRELSKELLSQSPKELTEDLFELKIKPNGEFEPFLPRYLSSTR